MTDIEIETELLNNIPSFEEYLYKNGITIKEGIYSYLTDFGIFLRSAIFNNNRTVVQQSFHLLNKWFSYNNADLDNKISTGILEILTDTKQTQTVCSKNLGQNGLAIFNKLFDKFQKLPPE